MLFPPRPSTAMPISGAPFLVETGHIWQYKVNDSRCVIELTPEKVTLWGRRKEPLKYTAPQPLVDQIRATQSRLGLDLQKRHILDGGLLHQKTKTVKNTIAIWDILVENNQHLLGTTYAERYERIAIPNHPYTLHNIEVGTAYTDDVFYMSMNPTGNIDNAWQNVLNTNNTANEVVLEGLVFKNPTVPLEPALKENNNGGWLCRCRIETGRHRF